MSAVYLSSILAMASIFAPELVDGCSEVLGVHAHQEIACLSAVAPC
jgi:hypothetical protein